MNMSNMKEIQKKDDKSLVAFIQEKREEIRAFRFGASGAGGTRNVRSVRQAKKDVARGLFELGVRTRAQSNENA